jgi:hypothetical protein
LSIFYHRLWGNATKIYINTTIPPIYAEKFLISEKSPETAALMMGPIYSSTVAALRGRGIFLSFISNWGSFAAFRILST